MQAEVYPQSVAHGVGHQSEPRDSGDQRSVSHVEMKCPLVAHGVGHQSESCESGGQHSVSHVEMKFPLELEDFLTNPAESLLPHRSLPQDARSGSEIWDKTILPLDFSTADFSDLEEQTRTLYQLGDSWIYHDDANPIMITDPIDLRPFEDLVQLWWDTWCPSIPERIIPFVRHSMVNNKDASIGNSEAYILALDHLAEGGALVDQKCAKEALGLFPKKANGIVGREHTVSVVFSHVMRCADYSAQNIPFGALHFAAVDMGEKSHYHSSCSKPLVRSAIRRLISVRYSIWHWPWSGG